MALSRTLRHPRRRPSTLLTSILGLLLLVALTGCSGVNLISEYDQQTDESLEQLQQDIESVLTKLERNLGTDAGNYDAYASRYDSIRVRLRTLKVRASSRPKNEIQVTQLGNVLEQIDLFEQAHKQGMSAEEIPPFRRGFNQSFRAMITLELAKKRGES